MRLSRRTFIGTLGAASVLSATGCDATQSWNLLPPPPRAAGPFSPPDTEEVDEVSHVISRLSFGPRPGDYERVRAMGVAAFMEEQLHPAGIDDSACDHRVRRFETLVLPAGELFEYHDDLLLKELTEATLLRAVYSERQLYEVMVGFWTDHFNIDHSKGDCPWLKTADDRDVIRRHALGRFPDLLKASALSPAMLWYLDGRANRHAPGEAPNENYARELLELHTLGVHGGYTQRDVMEVARCLTGWHVRTNEWFKKGAVEFRPDAHDNGEKEVLGQRIPPGGGRNDLDRVLHIVTRHPATAQHIAEKLCRRFMADAPDRGAVEVVATAFRTSGGDLPRTLKALFSHDAFLSSSGAKLKRPFRFVASALRATDAEVRQADALTDYLLRMGHAPFQYPTPDGYPDGTAPWEGTLLWRWHFAKALDENRLAGTHAPWERLREKAGGEAGLARHLLARRPTGEEDGVIGASRNAAALLLASPAFQRY